MSCADPRAINGKCTGSEFVCMQGPVCWEDAMSFNPTHEFRGLKLRYDYDYDVINGFMTSWYTTEDGDSICLPETSVTKITPKPQTGEVWKYVGEDFETTPLVLISNQVSHYINDEADEIRFGPKFHERFVKVLNADGTPA